MSTIDELSATTSSIAREIAAADAEHVDATATFPRRAIDALANAGVLGAAVPERFGGADHSLRELCSMCTTLARGCASTAMVVAMHHIQVASIARHCGDTGNLADYLRGLAKHPRLIASATSEVGPSGDLRRSVAAVERDGDTYRLIKHATTISYGDAADDLLITARRSSAAPESDQVLVLARAGNYQLHDVGTWDTLGMRGTCSPGARVEASDDAGLIVPEPFADIASMTMVPYSHILWAACWLGIAEEAVARTRACMRARGRNRPNLDVPIAGAEALSALVARLDTMRDAVYGIADELDRAGDPADAARHDDPTGIRRRAPTLGFALRMNNVKLSASTLLVEIVTQALGLCGIAAYKNAGPYSLGRHLRDAHSAPLMISNLRIHQSNAAILAVHKGGDA